MKPIAIVAAAVAILAAASMLVTQRSSGQASAEQLLRQASNPIELQPGEVLHLKTRFFNRAQPRASRLQDPYHLDLYGIEPELVIGDAWFAVDANGQVTERYARVVDERGALVQEESRKAGKDLVYSAATNALRESPAADALPRTVDLPILRPGSQASLAGRGNVAGLETRKIRIGSTPPDLPPNSSVYERPYLRDLDAVEAIEEVEISNENVVLRYAVDVKQSNGELVRVVETSVLVLERLPRASLSGDFFDLKTVSGAQPGAPAPPPPQVVELTTLAGSGRPYAVLVDSDGFGLKLQNVFASPSGADVTVPVDLRDVRFAANFGLGVRTNYSDATQAPRVRAVNLLFGPAGPLKAFLQQAPPFWNRAELIGVTLDGKARQAWLLTSDEAPELTSQLLVLDLSDGVLVIQAQNMESGALLALVGSVEVRE